MKFDIIPNSAPSPRTSVSMRILASPIWPKVLVVENFKILTKQSEFYPAKISRFFMRLFRR